jgi:hypothetical protein
MSKHQITFVCHSQEYDKLQIRFQDIRATPIKTCARHERTSEAAEDYVKYWMIQKQQTTQVHRTLEHNASLENQHALHKVNIDNLEIR